jgi:hypothetical protein
MRGPGGGPRRGSRFRFGFRTWQDLGKKTGADKNLKNLTSSSTPCLQSRAADRFAHSAGPSRWVVGPLVGFVCLLVYLFVVCCVSVVVCCLFVDCWLLFVVCLLLLVCRLWFVCCCAIYGYLFYITVFIS